MSPALAASTLVAARAFGPSSATSVSECLRPARVADHYVVSVRHRESRDLASDVSGPDESDRCHNREYTSGPANRDQDSIRRIYQLLLTRISHGISCESVQMGIMIGLPQGGEPET